MSQQQEPMEERYKPAPPDYGNEPPCEEGMEPTGRGQHPPPKPDSPLKFLLISGIIALVIVFLMNSFIMPTVGKKAYIDDITRLENDLVAMRAVEKSLGDKVTALETANKNNLNVINDALNKATNDINTKTTAFTNSLSNYATKDSLNKYATQDNINALQTSITNTKSELEAMIGKVSSDDIKKLQGQLDTLAKQLADLEEEVANIEVAEAGAKEPEVTLTQFSDFGTEVSHPSGYAYEATLKLTIENESDEDINITDLFISIYPNTTGVITGVQLTDLTSKSYWASVDSTTPLFYNYRDIEIDNDDKETYTLRVTIVLATNVGISSYESEVELQDWEES
jgi:hypothetical protein